MTRKRNSLSGEIDKRSGNKVFVTFCIFWRGPHSFSWEVISSKRYVLVLRTFTNFSLYTFSMSGIHEVELE